MLLAIDIGNTNISCGIFKGAKIIRTFNISTCAYNIKKLKANLGKLNSHDALICSVVPKVTEIILKDLTKLIIRKPLIIGKDIRVPIKNNYRKPSQVGQDRLVNAYAGAKFYGLPLVVVDFGTAITFDLISKSGAYEGGLILPGIGIAIDALNQKTALLPKINLNIPKEFIGKDTASSILSGIVYGFAAMTERLNTKLKKELGSGTKVIVTGGNSRLISRYCCQIDHTDPLLTLKGVNLIYKYFNKKTS